MSTMKYYVFILFLIFILPFCFAIGLSIYSFLESYYQYVGLTILTYLYVKIRKFRILFNLGFIYYTYYTFGYKYFENPPKQPHYAYVSHPCGRVKQIAENKFHIWYDQECYQNYLGTKSPITPM